MSGEINSAIGHLSTMVNSVTQRPFRQGGRTGLWHHIPIPDGSLACVSQKMIESITPPSIIHGTLLNEEEEANEIVGVKTIRLLQNQTESDIRKIAKEFLQSHFPCSRYLVELAISPAIIEGRQRAHCGGSGRMSRGLQSSRVGTRSLEAVSPANFGKILNDNISSFGFPIASIGFCVGQKFFGGISKSATCHELLGERNDDVVKEGQLSLVPEIRGIFLPTFAPRPVDITHFLEEFLVPLEVDIPVLRAMSNI
jgi:hypothetical protein